MRWPSIHEEMHLSMKSKHVVLCACVKYGVCNMTNTQITVPSSNMETRVWCVSASLVCFVCVCVCRVKHNRSDYAYWPHNMPHTNILCLHRFNCCCCCRSISSPPHSIFPLRIFQMLSRLICWSFANGHSTPIFSDISSTNAKEVRE